MGVGIHSLTNEERKEIGKKSGLKTYELGIGIFGLSPEQKSEISRRNGIKTKELGIGIFELSPEQRREIGRKSGKYVCSQKWKCLETGFITNPGNLTKYQKARGIDTSQRVRIE